MKRSKKVTSDKSEQGPPKRTIPSRRKPIPKFTVPTKVYESIIEELKNPNPQKFIEKQHNDYHTYLVIQQRCHVNSTEDYCFQRRSGMHKPANFLLAAKQALEARDYKSLYQICAQGLEQNNKPLNKIMYEYLYIAIENDPRLTAIERKKYLLEAVQGCKTLYAGCGAVPIDLDNENIALKHIQETHMLMKRTEENENLDSESD